MRLATLRRNVPATELANSKYLRPWDHVEPCWRRSQRDPLAAGVLSDGSPVGHFAGRFDLVATAPGGPSFAATDC